MKHYSVQTGWTDGGKVPSFKGDIEIIAINAQTADLCVLVDYVYMREIISNTSAEDLMPKGNDIYLGYGGLIAN